MTYADYVSAHEMAALFARPMPLELFAYSPTRIHATDVDAVRIPPLPRRRSHAPIFDPASGTYLEPLPAPEPRHAPRAGAFIPRHKDSGIWFCVSSDRQPMFYVLGTYLWARKEAFRWGRTQPTGFRFDIKIAEGFEL